MNINISIKDALSKVREFLKDTYIEAKKVAWPTRQYIVVATFIILALVLILALFLISIDFIFARGFRYLFKAI